VTLLSIVAMVLFVALLSRLWYLQVLASDRYTDLAAGNSVRQVVIQAPRGLILDRTGRVLAGNRAAWAVTVDLGKMGRRKDAVLSRLASLLHQPRARIDQRLASYTGPHPTPLRIPLAAVGSLSSRARRSRALNCS